jgi:hypothetical protein
MDNLLIPLDLLPGFKAQAVTLVMEVRAAIIRLCGRLEYGDG